MKRVSLHLNGLLLGTTCKLSRAGFGQSPTVFNNIIPKAIAPLPAVHSNRPRTLAVSPYKHFYHFTFRATFGEGCKRTSSKPTTSMDDAPGWKIYGGLTETCRETSIFQREIRDNRSHCENFIAAWEAFHPDGVDGKAAVLVLWVLPGQSPHISLKVALPYIYKHKKHVSYGPTHCEHCKEECPEIPLSFTSMGMVGLLEKMKGTGVDVIGLDWTVDMADGRRRLGDDISIQGNVDPAYLFMTALVSQGCEVCWTKGHILNLGHCVLVGTPEEAVARS
ncbi:hypothetical protein E3N88_35382 [Mikania micrantha]|uniref:Uroporphyrinogen decarboxylase (URO-D) domain-containing protein n=1 Tax=Mikania micrantha TaxID=192012 RepID=A0A5N6M171_9ASTR|nr:hypothetical protein E3N88_35382 [Mikania micrantha]